MDDAILAVFGEDPLAWDNFNKFPALYRRVRIDGIKRSRIRPEVFEARLKKLVENSIRGVMYGECNDNGRLL